MNFSGKVALVTGAGQGIGFEICRQLVHNGALVVLNDIDESLAQKSAQNITETTGGNCIALAGDGADLAAPHAVG